MAILTVINSITRIFFLLVATLTLIDLARYRDRLRLDSALVFNALAFIIIIGMLDDAGQLQALWVSKLGVVFLVAQPYLLLRVVGHFRPISRVVRGLVLAGWLASVGLLLTVPPDSTAKGWRFFVVLYFVLSGGYTSFAFVEGAIKATREVRVQLGLAAIGSGLLATIIFLAGVSLVWPQTSNVVEALSRVLGMLAAASYYLGFTPPSWIRRYWQLPSPEQYLEPENEVFLIGIVQSTDDAVIGQTLNGTIVSWNRGAEQMFGYSPDEVKGHPIAMLVAQDHQEELADILQATKRGQSIRDLETQRVRKDGTVIDVSFTISPVRDQLGNLIGASAIAKDITQLKQALRQNIALNAELEVRVAQRTAELEQANMNLRQEIAERKAAEEMVSQLNGTLQKRAAQLEASNKDLEAFAYSVSHDLRAPLRAIDGYSRLLVEDYAADLPDEVNSDLDRIRHNAQRMGELIDDLLNFSRLGRSPVERQAVTPATLVNRAISNLAPLYEGQGAEVQVGDLPECEGDPRLLYHVFANLLDNAFKYSSKKDKAHIRVGADVENGEAVYFVKDNGAGFDMRYADNLFGVFQRLHRDDEYPGSGVGLATVQRIINKHGGRIWVDAEINEGATFYFTLG